ncbi:MAG TPA: efflux transporter outer membrane subunit [Rhizomicrobium sp.]|jgi:NodT family efflux transporter outer membrane factor (OMF) lipoprotein|nr:efflux transporter outer membrane subunit [Rhizomicrobium sp.]
MRKPLLLLCAALLSTSVLGGCVDTPPTAPQLKSIQDSSLGLNGVAAPQISSEWWKAFGDPQVDRLAALVMANNPTLQGALARIRAAQAELAVDRTGEYPQATLDGQEQRLRFSKDYIIPPPYAGTYRWYGQVAANLTWDLDFWGKQADLIEQARQNANAAALDAAAAHLAIAGAFAQTYIDLVLAYEDGDIADANVRERGDILKLTEDRDAQGLESDAAVEQAKALLAMAKEDQIRVTAQRETIVHALAALAGQGADAYGGITKPTPQLDAALPLPEKLPVDLLSRRPDIIAAKARIAAALAGREAAHADFYPDINLTGLVGFQAIGLSNLIGANAFTYGAGPALHLPIFDAGKIKARYAGATAGLDSAIADYNNTVLTAVRQTADALTQVRSLTERRKQEADALASAQRAFTLAQSRYKSGLATEIVVLTAESTLLAAREQMAALIAQSAVERATLLLCVGGGFEPPAAAKTDATDAAKPESLATN